GSRGMRNRRAFGGAVAVVSLLAFAFTASAATTGAQSGGHGLQPFANRDEQRFVPGELIVRFKSGVGEGARAAALRAEGAALGQKLRLPRTELVRLRAGEAVTKAAADFERRPDVLYAEPNYIYGASATPNDPRFGDLWGLNQASDVDIDAPEAWDVTTGSSNVVVAVADTGIAYDHPDLAPNMWANPGEIPANGLDDDANGYVDDVRGRDFSANDSDPRDENSHGTHVAGTIAARGNNGVGVTGVSWNASLMAVRVLDAAGSGTAAGIANGFDYAGDEGARIVNASLGGPAFSQTMKDAIDAHPNTLFVVAAGNENSNNDVSPRYPCSYVSINVICVAATTRTNGRAGFSNYGATSVDLGAPGTEILSTWAAYDTWFTDGFEDPLAWTAGGTPNTWAAVTSPKLDGAKSGTDSPAGPYPDFSDNWFRTTNAINLSGRVGCIAQYAMMLDTEPDFDGLVVEGSTNPSSPTWTLLDGWSGRTTNFPSSWFLFETPLEPFSGEPAFYLRFGLLSDDSVQGEGAYLDRVSVQCIGTTYDADDYATIQGTSMASPHVAGVAALLLAVKPTASVAELKAALLGSGDPVPALAGATVTGKRVNARAAIAWLLAPPQPPQPPPPPPADTTGPIDPVVTSPSHTVGVPSRNRVVQFRWSGASDAGSGVDGFSFHVDQAPVSTPDRIKDAEENIAGVNTAPLPNGRYYFHLSTVDNAGNWTNTRHLGPIIISVPRAGSSVRCRVPNVRGRTVARARRLLARANCRLGAVRRVYSGRVRSGLVVSQSRRPGARLPRGTRVNVKVSRGRRR
ncbi:MAG TPA: S8 family serine peptidase, partial [Actinomycetota bacterium]|nr:S8 family serine peptidase [Actinomycetota bacterium]